MAKRRLSDFERATAREIARRIRGVQPGAAKVFANLGRKPRPAKPKPKPKPTS